MNVLFCSTGINALGETFTLALFAEELLKQGHNCFFIAPKLGRDYLLTFGFLEDRFLILPTPKEQKDNFNLNYNKSLFDSFVNRVQPDFVLVADWHHYKSDGFSNNDAYSFYWFDKSIPIGTFDHLGFAPKGKEVFQDEIKNLIHTHTLNQFQGKDFLPLPERITFIIRPCPHHRNDKLYQDNIYYWGVYRNKISKDTESIEKIRESLSLKEEKIIFNPIGLWQEKMMDYIFQDMNIKYDYYTKSYFPIVFHYLSKINIKIVYISIAGSVKKEERINYKNISFCKIPPIKHKLFMDYLLASDIFLTDNLMSSNLGKAVFGNILPVVFKSSVYQGKDASLKTSFKISEFVLDRLSFLMHYKIIFPFRSFPVGLRELEEMYKNNSFANCFIEQELYDEERNIQLFEEILTSDKHKNNIIAAQDEYIKNNSELLTAEKILLKVSENSRNC